MNSDSLEMDKLEEMIDSYQSQIVQIKNGVYASFSSDFQKNKLIFHKEELLKSQQKLLELYKKIFLGN